MRQSRAMQPRPPRALWLRGRWPDHNPLRRTSDRVEAAIVAAALILFLAGAPLLALFGWHWADSAKGTVRNYLSSCIQKTGARNRAEAIRIARVRGWL